jgi:hypothetical protein
MGLTEIVLLNLHSLKFNYFLRDTMNSKMLTIIKEQVRNTMTTVGMVVSVVYIMRWLGFEGQFVVPYESYWALVLGSFIGLVIRAYCDEQD